MADKPEQKGKPVKKGKSFSRYKLYTVVGDKVTRKNKTCPKCGADSFLAAHKDRLTCGKSNYMEKIAKK